MVFWIKESFMVAIICIMSINCFDLKITWNLTLLRFSIIEITFFLWFMVSESIGLWITLVFSWTLKWFLTQNQNELLQEQVAFADVLHTSQISSIYINHRLCWNIILFYIFLSSNFVMVLSLNGKGKKNESYLN